MKEKVATVTRAFQVRVSPDGACGVRLVFLLKKGLSSEHWAVCDLDLTQNQ